MATEEDRGLPRGWVQPKQAASWADVSVRTVHSWFKKGLRRSKVGTLVLVSLDDLDSFIRAHESGPVDRAELEAARIVKGLV